jgi:hypothetical protein
MNPRDLLRRYIAEVDSWLTTLRSSHPQDDTELDIIIAMFHEGHDAQSAARAFRTWTRKGRPSDLSFVRK